MHGRPPPLPQRATRPDPTEDAGVLFTPGKWPTPELSFSPVGRFFTLTAPSAYTSGAIQSALNSLGPASTLYLPQSSVWSITETIQLFEHQELATWGYPTGEKDMARLDAGKDCRPHVISARAKSGAKVRNLVVDGGRERYGYDSNGGVMLQFGNRATDQVIDRCIICNPRHWSCIQAFEGCQNVRITNNFIGPAGVGADKENGKWADGISFAGSNGLVAGNKIQDATDGAIVAFGAPGTLITSNTIIAQERLCLGGINMVDWAPHDGNYVQTRVTHNTVMTQGPGGYIKTGIGQGPSVWWTSNSSDPKFNRGAIVAKNLIDSKEVGLGRGSIGYGFAVAADVKDWTCIGNKSSAAVQYQGDITKSLPYPNVAPGPFVHDIPQARLRFSDTAQVSVPSRRTEDVILQPEFSNGKGNIKSLISISPGASHILAYQPGQFHMKKGSAIILQEISAGYEQDGIIRIRERLGKESGTVLWDSKPYGKTTASDTTLTYMSGGKLCIVDTSDQLCLDLSPHLPLHAVPGSDEDCRPILIFSDTNPHLSIITPASSSLFMSSHIFPPNRAFPGGQVVARTCLYGNSPRTLLYTLSPYCQFVVLRSKEPSATVPTLPLKWPDVSQEAQWGWEVIWTTPNPRTKEKRTDAMMYFQGDGNLVIRSQNTVPWASGSNGKSPPAKYMRLGIGSAAEPWIEILDTNCSRVWSS